MLFHCSNKCLKELLPRSEWTDKNGSKIHVIYASHSLAYALPFGLSYRLYQPQSKWELHVKNSVPHVYVYEGEINRRKDCWLYVLNENYFRKINEYEWICERRLTDFEISRIKASTILNYVHTVFYNS